MEASDAADAADLAALLESISVDTRSPRWCTRRGVLADGTVSSLSPEQIHTAMRPKVDAAWNLHRQTSGSRRS